MEALSRQPQVMALQPGMVPGPVPFSLPQQLPQQYLPHQQMVPGQAAGYQGYPQQQHPMLVPYPQPKMPPPVYFGTPGDTCARRRPHSLALHCHACGCPCFNLRP